MIASHFLHTVAWTAVRTAAPRQAFSVVKRVARWMPPLSVRESVEVGHRLRGGTCLTRSMVVAARLPGASVVIGCVARAPFRGHAWVELDGAPLPKQSVTDEILGRLVS